MNIGIDLGGTNIRFGLVRDGRVAEGFSVPSFPKDARLEETFDYLKANIRKLAAGRPFDGIGIGVPSVVDCEKGIVYDTVNIPCWKEVHLGEVLREEFGVPVMVNNDANCFTLGAYHYFGCELPSFVGMTLGTGVGTGVIVDGRLFSGRRTGVGELGCIPWEDADLETTCCSKFFLRRGTTGRAAAEAAAAGDPDARALWAEYGRNLGRMASVAMYAYDPDMIVFGGGIAASWPLFQDALWTYLHENHQYGKAVSDLRIDVLTGDDIGTIGAAYLATK